MFAPAQYSMVRYKRSLDWWLLNSVVDMDFVNDRYHVVPNDALAANCVLMLHGDGVDASSNISDSTGRHFLSAGPTSSIPEIDTAQSKFGGASILCAGANSAISDVSTDFLFGTGDFTVDFWLHRNTTGQCNIIGLNSGDFTIYLAASGGVPKLFWSGADRIVGSTSIANGVWRHISFTRSGNDHRLFLDGVQEGSTYTAANNYTSDQITVGHGSLMTGWLDEVRVLKGVAAWTANFTPPTQAYDVGIGPYDMLSITRASVGYAQTVAGTLTAFAANQLRITDQGLLIEDARTNLQVKSEDLGNGFGWTVENITVTADQATAPNGTVTMDKLDDVTVNDIHRIYHSNTISTPFTASFFVKDIDRRYVMLQLAGNGNVGSVYGIFDLQAGTVSDSGVSIAGTGTSFTSATIEALANGIYRISVTGVPNTLDAAPYTIFWLSDRPTYTGTLSLGGPSYTGTNKSVYAWGAQVEVGAFASSYIPTDTAAATRAADTVTATRVLGTVLTATPGSVLADVKANATPSGFQRILGNEGTDSHELLGTNTSSDTSVVMYNGTNVLAATLGGATQFTLGVKVASGWDGSGRSVVGGGGTVATDANLALPSPVAYLGRANSPEWHGYYRRLTAWDSRLADATLQNYTDPVFTGALAGYVVDLNFAAGSYDLDDNTVYPLLSCVRASVGYAQTVAGVLTPFAANQLRITDKGLLIEDARTNVVPASQTFDNATYWTPSNSSVTANATTAPDGTTTADKLVEAATTAAHYLVTAASVGVAIGSTIVASIFLKAAGRTTAVVALDDGGSGNVGVTVDLTNGNVADAGYAAGEWTGFSFTSEALANGWYRINLKATLGVARTNILFYLFTRQNTSYAGNGTDGVYAWGAQVEVGAFVSSYIPTTSAAATRARDVVAATGSLDTLFSSAAVSAVADIKTIRDTPIPGEAWVILGDNAGSEKALMNVDDSSDSAGQFLTGGASATIGGVLTSDDGIKVGGSWNASATSIVAQGGTVGNGAAFTAGIASMSLGGEIQARFRIYGYFRRLTAWNTRLADATLQGFTNP